MLQPGNLSQQQKVQLLNPEAVLVSEGKLRAQNPDNTSPADRVALVKEFLEKSEASPTRREAEQYWKEADRFCEGKHWANATGANKEFQFTINKIYAIKEKLVSLLVDSLAEVEFLERNANDVDIAKAIDNFFRHEFERWNWMQTLRIALEESIKHKTSFIKVYWDANEDGGRGAVRLEAISNYDLFLDEGAMIKDGQLSSKSIIHRMDKSRNEIIAQWKVDPQGDFQKMMGMKESKGTKKRPLLDAMREESRIARGGSPEKSRPPGWQARKDDLEVYECHYQDDSLIRSPGMNDSEPAVLRYPHGRIITICNGHVLYDKPNYAGFCMFVPLTTEPSIKKIYGPSILNQLSGMQMALNKGFSQIYEHSERCANPIKKVSARSVGLNQDTDLSESGATVVVMGDDVGVEYVTPPDLGKEVMEVNVMSNEFMEDVSGVHDPDEGRPSSARSGVAIERLQSASLTRSNLRSIDNDQGLKVIARNVSSLFLDFVNSDRQFRFLDEDTQQEMYVTFNAGAMIFPKRVERIKEIQQQQAMIQYQLENALQMGIPLQKAIEFEQYGQQQIEMLQLQIVQVQAMPAHDLVSLDVRILTGSRSATKQQRKSEAIMFKELDMATDADVLKIMEVPNYRKIVENKAEEHKAQADAQAAAQAEMLAIEKEKLALEHQNAMELQELQGTLQLVIEKLEAQTQLTVARMKESGKGD